MQDYSNIGKETMQAISEYNFLLKSIEFELKISGGWLKPIRLKQLTGVLAQDRIEKQYAEDKKKNRNFILRSKIKTESKTETWRNFFSENELKDAYSRIQQGLDENEDDSSGSDSEPSEDNLTEVKIIQEKVIEKSFVKTEENRSYSVANHIKPKRTAIDPKPEEKKKARKSVEAFYPHTSRTAITKLETNRPLTSSKVFSKRESRSGMQSPGFSPMIFQTFRKNLGFYQQILIDKGKLAQGSLEIMCTKLITAKKPKYK